MPVTFGSKLEEYTQLVTFPAVHLSGLLYRVTALMYRGQNILIDPPASAQDICAAIQKYRVNVMTMAPVALISLMR